MLLGGLGGVTWRAWRCYLEGLEMLLGGLGDVEMFLGGHGDIT